MSSTLILRKSSFLYEMFWGSGIARPDAGQELANLPVVRARVHVQTMHQHTPRD